MNVRGSCPSGAQNCYPEEGLATCQECSNVAYLEVMGGVYSLSHGNCSSSSIITPPSYATSTSSQGSTSTSNSISKHTTGTLRPNKPTLKPVANAQTKRAKIKCSQCSEWLAGGYNLRRHVETVHEGMKPFSCLFSGCDVRFGQKAQVATHMATNHGEDRPYICDYPNCTFAFAIKGSLTNHRRARHNIYDGKRRN
jgi:hypothetical protein